MLLIFEQNSRIKGKKDKRVSGKHNFMVNDTVIEPKRILDGRKHGK